MAAIISLYFESGCFFPGIVKIFYHALASLSVAEGQPAFPGLENRGSPGGGPKTRSRAARTGTSPEDALVTLPPPVSPLARVRAAVTSPGPRDVGRRGLDTRGSWVAGMAGVARTCKRPAVPGGCGRGSPRSCGKARSRLCRAYESPARPGSACSPAGRRGRGWRAGAANICPGPGAPEPDTGLTSRPSLSV